MKTAAQKAAEVADYIRGTCKSLENGIEDVLGQDEVHLELNGEFCGQIDDMVFCCVGCGWWCGNDEMGSESGGGYLCHECDDGEEEDD